MTSTMMTKEMYCVLPTVLRHSVRLEIKRPKGGKGEADVSCRRSKVSLVAIIPALQKWQAWAGLPG